MNKLTVEIKYFEEAGSKNNKIGLVKQKINKLVP